MKLVIDWSVICHQNWHTMFSANYVATEDEVTEWTKNLADSVVYLTTRFDPSEVIFAMDAPGNWRADYTKNWYHESLDWYMDNADARHWYVWVDKTLYEISFEDISKKWRVSKPKAPVVKVLELDNSQLYTCYAKGNTPEHVLEMYPDAPKHVTLMKSWDGLKLAVPYYKGTRSSAKWPAQTPKTLFKQLIPELGAKMAPLVGGRAIMAPHAEGDDVVACTVERWASESPDERIVLVTVDADLEQLFVIAPNLSIFNPVKREIKSNDANEANYHLVNKIIGGDSSDNIKGISMTSRKASMPTVSYDVVTGSVKDGKGTANWVQKCMDAAKEKGLVGADYWGSIYRTLYAEAVIDTLERNMTLVFLKNIPDSITVNIYDQITNLEVEETALTWDDFMLTTEFLEDARNRALADKSE